MSRTYEIEDGMGFAGLVGTTAEERQIERLTAGNGRLKAQCVRYEAALMKISSWDINWYRSMGEEINIICGVAEAALADKKEE